ncbi:MAG: tetratricopeptide repeat protein [Woeseiaceae bacterium]
MTKLLKFCIFIVAVSAIPGTSAAQLEQAENDDEVSPTDQAVTVADDETDASDPVSPLDQVVTVADDETDASDPVSPLDQVVPVAEDETDTSVPVMSDQDDERSLDQQLSDEFERYRSLVRDGVMDEADTSAKRIVEMVIRLYGPQSLETSKALNNLALVQSRNEQYDAAIQNFESAIEIIEIVKDRLNEELVNPLTGLGSAHLQNGRPDLAAKTYGRARHITHVNEGPHNIQQVEILEALAQANLLIGDTKGARALLDRMHALNVRHFAGNELALIPSLMRRASWQHAARYYNDERATYRRIVRIMENKLGKNDPQLILPLSKLGESFYFVDMSQAESQQRGMVSTGEVYFKRALRIADATPDIDWQEYARVKLALADYYVYGQGQNRARSLYKEVWRYLSADEERLAMRREALEQPVALVEDAIPKYAFKGADTATSDEALLTGTIRVDYSVSTRGRVRNIRTEAMPPEFTDMQRMVHREIRRRVFRPQMSDEALRVSDNQVFVHEFLYRQADLDKLIEQNEQTTSSSKRKSSET